MNLQAVCTLKFTSNVTALAAATICGHQFIVVCTKDPNVARVFRLNSIEDDIKFQKENKKIWEFANDPKNQQAQMNIFNDLQFPYDNPQVSPNQQFIEAQLGDNKFLLNFCCLQLTLTPIIDMKLNNPASSCLFTTFERQVKRLGPEEDIMPNEILFGMTYEGALLIVGGQYGLVQYTVIPLAQLMLDVPPLRYNSAIDVLKIGMQSREQKLKHSIHELFTFPPESQFMDLGRSPVSIAEDNRRIIIKGERTYAVRFDPYLGRTAWLSLFNDGGIRNIVPIGAFLKSRLKENKQRGLEIKIILLYLLEQYQSSKE
ncbi:MAG: hypothetical protein EZS28_009312 [Streblomastix strix]|uniref:Uncharacterized protein n=1 Tax=Streblomastix strix TaxID=222440 RepID=A0A5J4WJA3_9EUKA|nr:MAG: hypothetical protein EZS28_009312 [Streblomastix strix]